MINDSVDRFAQENVKSSEWDAAAAMPEDIVQKVSELGLMGLLVDEELGGMGLPMMAYSRIFENLATHDASLTVTVGAHQSIGYKGLLLFGSPEQKENIFPDLQPASLSPPFVSPSQAVVPMPPRLRRLPHLQRMVRRIPSVGRNFGLPMAVSPTFLPSLPKYRSRWMEKSKRR